MISQTKLLSLAVAAALAVGAAGCFGGGGGGEDPWKILDQTFSSNKQVDSARIELVLSITASGVGGGNLEAKLSGPFETKQNKFPRLNLTAEVTGSGAGQNISFNGGVISTGSAAFINYQGTNYRVDDNTFNQFKSQYESQAATSRRQKSANPFARFGIRPRQWLTNVKNEGNESVAGADTIHISGDADVRKVIADFRKLLDQAGRLGLPAGAALPDASQLEQARQAVRRAHFDIFTGADDKILRRLATQLTIEPESGPSKVEINFSITLSDLNEPQTVRAPSGAKPLSDLLGSLNLGGLSPSTGSGAGGTPGGGPSPGQSQRYLNCLQKASDPQECSQILQ